MRNKKISIKVYLYICIIGLAFFISVSTLFISYKLSTNQVNKNMNIMAWDNAKNFASMLDGDYIGKLRNIIESKEFQDIRIKAEQENNEELIKDYLIDLDMWEEYSQTRDYLNQYLDNISAIKYLYIIAQGDINTTEDMYLMDDYDNSLINVGMYEEREAEFLGKDITHLKESVVTNTHWGYLISNYAPVYDSNGNCVAVVGCDIDISQIMSSRHKTTVYIIGIVLTLSIIGLVINIHIINKHIISPLADISRKVNLFTIDNNMDEKNSNVLTMSNITTKEINNIYIVIQNLQIRIIDFTHKINKKDEKIRKLDISSHKDGLTNVNNKNAYLEKIMELNNFLYIGNDLDVAIIMCDVNNLKHINDKFGHDKGDEYLKKCCKILCDTFVHSPVYRIGGDEFVIIAQGSDFDNRYTLYNSLLEQFNIYYNKRTKPMYERYSMSLGMSECTSDDVNMETVFKRADSIMYKNKNKFKQMEKLRED